MLFFIFWSRGVFLGFSYNVNESFKIDFYARLTIVALREYFLASQETGNSESNLTIIFHTVRNFSPPCLCKATIFAIMTILEDHKV